MVFSKITERKEDEEDNDDDDDEEVQSRDRKRKRTEAPLGNGMMMVVKLVSDAGLEWRSGERTTNPTKRSTIVNELTSSSNANNANTDNIMGRRSNLTLRNRHGVDLCLVEFKNASTHGEEISQDSKSLRCTKFLRICNSSLGNKLMWSMNRKGYEVMLLWRMWT